MGKSLIVGIGSPHGDDRAGWVVIERLQSVRFNVASLLKASVPHDLLDWMEETDSLQIIDCYKGEHPDSPLLRIELQPAKPDGNGQFRLSLSREEYPSTVSIVERPVRLRSAGSHQIDVFTVLELAASLHQLPQEVILWGVPGQRFQPGETISSNCEAAMQECVTAIIKEFRDA